MLLPPLKWAGGKRRLVHLIKPMWENSGKPRLVEPFCGGIAISLGLQPQYALLNDINPHLINFYRWLKNGFHFDIPIDDSDEVYYRKRNDFNKLIREGAWDTEEAAQLFYFLNKNCFNGLCRFNREGYFNVPVGKFNYEVKYPSSFDEYTNTFAKWVFSCGDFSKLEITPNDFIFADPPYDVEFRGYSKDGFGWADQELLVNWLDLHSGPVVLCNHATERIKRLYTEHQYDLIFIDEKICITANGQRHKANVVLACKNISCDQASPFSFLQDQRLLVSR